MRHLDLFSGIGGFALAADRVWGTVEHTFCEIDPFCQEVLKKHWPKSKIYGDIRTLTNTERKRDMREFGQNKPKKEKESEIWQGKQYGSFESGDSDSERPLILTGGFPCQPFSQAGVRRGTNDDRHLWPEMLRVISEFRPEWVIAENVAGLLSIENGMVFEQVCSDLEREGYEVWPFVIPACAVGAPHRRDRIWFVANIDCQRRWSRSRWNLDDNANINPQCSRGERKTNGRVSLESQGWSRDWFEVATRLCRVDDGLPRRLDRNPRLKALGNAIVPQVAEEIMKAINLLTP